jgi:hypothetical protein
MFCRIHVDSTDFRTLFLLSSLADYSKAPFIDNCLEWNEITIWIRTNDEYEKRKKLEFPGGFLYFKYMMEFEYPLDSHKYVLGSISKLLNELWVLGVPAVASCSFENELPNSGGYGNRSLPWPVR